MTLNWTNDFEKEPKRAFAAIIRKADLPDDIIHDHEAFKKTITELRTENERMQRELEFAQNACGLKC